MPADECRDCEAHHPGGKGLIDGRCRDCHAYYLEQQHETPAKTPRPRPKAKRR